MLQSWKDQFEENLEMCRPELLASMQKKGTLEKCLENREAKGSRKKGKKPPQEGLR